MANTSDGWWIFWFLNRTRMQILLAGDDRRQKEARINWKMAVKSTFNGLWNDQTNSGHKGAVNHLLLISQVADCQSNKANRIQHPHHQEMRKEQDLPDDSGAVLSSQIYPLSQCFFRFWRQKGERINKQEKKKKKKRKWCNKKKRFINGQIKLRPFCLIIISGSSKCCPFSGLF